MRHVALTAASVAAVLVAIVACEQQAPDRNPLAPDAAVAYGKALGGECDAARLKLITTQQGDLYNRPQLDSAKAMMQLVTNQCSNGTGENLMLDYIQFTIAHRGVEKSTATDAQLLTHWNTVFPYVGLTGANQPSTVPLTIFTDSGAAKVIKWNVGGEITAANAALTQSVQDTAGDQRDHLFVIYPISSPCLSGNIQQFGPCFQISAFPHLPSGRLFSPKNKIGICIVHSLSDAIEDHISAPALGHLDPLTRVTETLNTHYPSTCGDVASAPVGSWNRGFGEAVKRLAWMAKKAVTPEPLYAVHGGLGGLGGGLSPFGAIDREVFKATFTNDVAGSKPGTPETGTWTVDSAKAPGTIVIANSLGQQNSRLVVLNQSGGNCATCFGLLLQGTLETAGTADSIGVYDAEFDALQAQSNMKEAVFVLRDNLGRDIARVTYAVRNNRNVILYNDYKNHPGLELGLWPQNVPRHFKIRVDLDANTTTVWFNNATDAALSGAAFVDTRANNFSTISADFKGIDSGTMGWDNIVVTRLSDINN
jgi:hypothetical protein